MTPGACPGCGFENEARNRFCGGCGSPLGPPADDARVARSHDEPPAPPAPQASPLPDDAFSRGERRRLTLMFVDLVGSTRMSSILDPEEMLEVIRRYQRDVSRIVERRGGSVLQYMGDGVLACFGFPKAHEDDAARCIQAALDCVGALRDSPDARPAAADIGPLAARVGVATGLVVVGADPSDDALRKTKVVGEAVNVAARIQNLAEPNQVLATGETRRLAGARFVFGDPVSQRVKGIARPVDVHAVLSAAPWAGDADIRRQAALDRVIGRDSESARLDAWWREARAGAARTVVVSGEPGIGKSTLAERLFRAAAPPEARRVRFQCSPQEQDTALYPHIVQLTRAAGFRPDDDPATRRARLEDLAGATGDGDRLALFAALLSIGEDDRTLPSTMAPQRQLQLTLEALRDDLLALARRGPTLIVYEDVHWIDPTSLTLLGMLAQSRPAAPLLLVITTREPSALPWLGAQGVAHLPLAPLSLADSRGVVDALAASGSLPPELVDDIAARADGVPLFLAELTRMILQGQSEEPVASAGVRSQRPIPDSLQELLAERLDRLGPAKRVAQVAAALGREFRLDHLLSALEPQDRPGARDALDALTRSSLVIERPRAAPARFAFRHALIQDAAYATMLRSARSRLHARIAADLAAPGDGAARNEAHLIARHLALADSHGPAARQWIAAAQQSSQRGMLREAVSHYRSGLAATARMEDGPERKMLEFQLLAGLGPSLMVMSGPGDPEFGEVQTRALDLCRELGVEEALFPLSFGQCVHRWGHADLAAASAMSSELLAAAEASGDAGRIMAAATTGVMVGLHRGDLAGASAHAERVLALFDPSEHLPLYDVYLLDFSVFCSFYLALAHTVSGRPLSGRAQARETLALARRAARPHPRGFALLADMMTAAWSGDVSGARRAADECIAFSSEQGFPEFVALAKIGRAWARGATESPHAILDDLRDGIALWRSTGFETWQSWFGAVLARTLLAAGAADEALAAVEEQLDRIAKNGETLFEAELLAAKAAILGAQSPRNGEVARRLYREAIASARRQGAGLWEARAAAELSAVLRAEGRFDDALALRAAVSASDEKSAATSGEQRSR